MPVAANCRAWLTIGVLSSYVFDPHDADYVVGDLDTLRKCALMTVMSTRCAASAKLIDQYMLGLRTGDALHLAIISEHGATLHTLDQRFAEAGPMLGMPTQVLA